MKRLLSALLCAAMVVGLAACGGGGGASMKVSGPSTVVDVAITENGTWSLIDTKRSKVFTYDRNGNMLYAFGDFGDQGEQPTQSE